MMRENKIEENVNNIKNTRFHHVIDQVCVCANIKNNFFLICEAFE